MLRDRNEDTICALSTPAGHGGIAVIRVSGPKAIEIVSEVFPKFKKQKPESHRAYFGAIKNKDSQKIDEVVATYFAKGHSYTGDDVIEISCHGSTYIIKEILDLLTRSGCRIADKGEFTFRAFMNGRLDLVQAESVLSLIQSESKQENRLAMRQLEGHVSKVFDQIESDLTWCLAHIEASIDFSTEGLDVVDHNVLIQKLNDLKVKLNQIVSSYDSGRIIRNGIKLVFFGEPNVGKSSLFNLMAQDDKAIVTDIAGTTRDVIETVISFSGFKLSLSDTAGLRETSDQVEIIGVQKSKSEANKADILLVVLDLNPENWPQTIRAANEVSALRRLYIVNKTDLLSPDKLQEIKKKLHGFWSDKPKEEVLFISSLASSSRETVLDKCIQMMGAANLSNDAILSSARQFEAAQYALERLELSIADLESGLGSEFVAMNLKESLISLQKILGRVYDDQILDRVFKEFCLGK